MSPLPWKSNRLFKLLNTSIVRNRLYTFQPIKYNYLYNYINYKVFILYIFEGINSYIQQYYVEIYEAINSRQYYVEIYENSIKYNLLESYRRNTEHWLM